MTTPPFVREAGSGPGVVCIHSNASSSSQWRGLMEMLAPRYQVLAPDLYGAGKSPDWHSNRMITLDDEVALIEPVLARVTAPLVMVGHSYGGAVTLKAALTHLAHVRALVLYEPTLFALLEAEKPSPNQADGIRHAVLDAAAALDRGDPDAAAEAFIDYWMQPGAWAATPEQRKPAIAASVVNVRRWGHALMTEPTPLAAFAALKIPVLYLLGQQSPESARGVARLLVPVLPQVEVVSFEKLGHMGPITHPEVVNTAIAGFIARL